MSVYDFYDCWDQFVMRGGGGNGPTFIYQSITQCFCKVLPKKENNFKCPYLLLAELQQQLCYNTVIRTLRPLILNQPLQLHCTNAELENNCQCMFPRICAHPSAARFITGRCFSLQLETTIKQAEEDRNRALEKAKKVYLEFVPLKDEVWWTKSRTS